MAVGTLELNWNLQALDLISDQLSFASDLSIVTHNINLTFRFLRAAAVTHNVTSLFLI